MALNPADFPLPPPPEFSSPGEEREHSKRVASAAFRLFHKLGFEEGVMGHISFRDPEFPERFWLNPYAVSFAHICASDLMCVDQNDGSIVEGEGYAHPGGVPQHAAIYAECPEVRSIAHAHTVYGRAWSMLGELLAPLSTEACFFFERHQVYDSYELGEGEELGKAASGNRAVIMKNHGVLTVGQTVEEACYLFVALEKVCHEQLLARAAGEPLQVPLENARFISNLMSPHAGWLNFKPLYDVIVREQPDLLG